ncbi:MAG TPA: DUF4743 domain-containing protein [Casimicrobiaceae bacterium]|nr:DUF4743 domain-containing protein [Casimicrobiaceae bacterium]
MIDDRLLEAIHTRLSVALAPPRGEYVALRVEGTAVGWLDRDRAARVLAFDRVFEQSGDGIVFVRALDNALTRTDALVDVAHHLADEGLLTAWRDERYEIATAFRGPALFELERAAARYFGIVTYAAHVNGVVEGEDDVRMWIARRSATKSIDPGLLDNLVGGGIRARTSVRETVTRESAEEAGIDAVLARRARPAGAVRICRAQRDGLQREMIYVHDLVLPPDFTPAGVDGEVMEHRLVTVDAVAALIANAQGADVATADASLVIVDWLLRRGVIHPDQPYYLALAGLRWPTMQPALA